MQPWAWGDWFRSSPSEPLVTWPYPRDAGSTVIREGTRSSSVPLDVDLGYGENHAFALRYGWPMRALATWGDVPDGRGSEVNLKHGVFLARIWPHRMAGGLPCILGWYPIWGGVVLNTVFFAAAGFVLWRGPRIVRWVRRRRAGTCISCGYDLRGLGDGAVCPECGKPNAAVSAAAERRELVAQGGAQRNPGSTVLQDTKP